MVESFVGTLLNRPLTDKSAIMKHTQLMRNIWMGQTPGALVNTQIAGYLIWELPKYGILGFDSSSLHIPTHEIGKASDPFTNHAPPIHRPFTS